MLRRFFEDHPRFRVATLIVFIGLGLFLIPRALAFGEYFTAIVLIVCLPAAIWSLVVVLRSGALRGRPPR